MTRVGTGQNPLVTLRLPCRNQKERRRKTTLELVGGRRALLRKSLFYNHSYNSRGRPMRKCGDLLGPTTMLPNKPKWGYRKAPECYRHKVKCSHQTTICQNLVKHSGLSIDSFSNAILKSSILTAAVFCESLSSLACEAGADRSWETQSQILDFQRILGSFCSLNSFLICGRDKIYWR